MLRVCCGVLRHSVELDLLLMVLNVNISLNLLLKIKVKVTPSSRVSVIVDKFFEFFKVIFHFLKGQ